MNNNPPIEGRLCNTQSIFEETKRGARLDNLNTPYNFISMRSKNTLAGDYLKESHHLHGVQNQNHLFIGSRKKPTIQKPANFLIDKVRNKYISSLYPIGVNEYKFDHNGENYKLSFNLQRATIEPLKAKCHV